MRHLFPLTVHSSISTTGATDFLYFSFFFCTCGSRNRRRSERWVGLSAVSFSRLTSQSVGQVSVFFFVWPTDCQLTVRQLIAGDCSLTACRRQTVVCLISELSPTKGKNWRKMSLQARFYIAIFPSFFAFGAGGKQRSSLYWKRD